MAKISKKSKRRLCLLTMVVFALVIALVGTVFKDWMQIMAITSESSTLEMRYQTLLESEESLDSELTKLQDPDYVARYAREKYLYSKDGETIIRIP